MNLKDINKIIDLYDSIIFHCDSLLKQIVDEHTHIQYINKDIKEDFIEIIEKIRDKTINTLKVGDDE